MDFIQKSRLAYSLVDVASRNAEAYGLTPGELAEVFALAAKLSLVAATEPGPEREALALRCESTVAEAQPGFAAMDCMAAVSHGN